MSHNCVNCGRENPDSMGQRESRFCSPKCRDSYHNDIRKAQRAVFSIASKLPIIEEICNSNEHKAIEISRMITILESRKS